TAEVGIVLLLQPSLSFIWDILFFNRSIVLIESLGVLMVLFAIYLGSKRTI
ncbi:MAG: drug/metabolite transporter (DMT)-like permease, partial [Woeseiaceae bacterium]